MYNIILSMKTTNNHNKSEDCIGLERDGSRVEVFGESNRTEELAAAVVLCFHGSGSEAGPDWRTLIAKFAEEYIVVLFDRGSGNSSTADHISVVSDYLVRSKLNGRPLVLVAHSYGGLFAKKFLYMHRRRVAGMVLVETGKGGQISREEALMLRQCWMDSLPLSVIRGNSLLEQWKSFERKVANASNEQESNELESRREWLQMCDEEDERLEKEQLKLSHNQHYIHLPYCGHNVIRDAPDMVVAEVEWVLANRCSQAATWSFARWLREVLKTKR